MKYQRGRFNPDLALVAVRPIVLGGKTFQAGENVEGANLDDRRRRQLWEMRRLQYAEHPRYNAPPVPPRTAPVRETLAERQADESAASAGQTIVDGLKDAIVYAEGGEDASAYDPREPDTKADIVPDNWRDLHWKQLVVLAKELGGEAANKAEAVAFIEAHLDGQPS